MNLQLGEIRAGNFDVDLSPSPAEAQVYHHYFRRTLTLGTLTEHAKLFVHIRSSSRWSTLNRPRYAITFRKDSSWRQNVWEDPKSLRIDVRKPYEQAYDMMKPPGFFGALDLDNDDYWSVWFAGVPICMCTQNKWGVPTYDIEEEKKALVESMSAQGQQIFLPLIQRINPDHAMTTDTRCVKSYLFADMLTRRLLKKTLWGEI